MADALGADADDAARTGEIAASLEGGDDADLAGVGEDGSGDRSAGCDGDADLWCGGHHDNGFDVKVGGGLADVMAMCDAGTGRGG